jgi:membrane protein implicated in regulation of membrane protease activity
MSFPEFITSPLMGVYFVCAVFGCALIFLQLLLMFFGFGDGDVGDGDGDVSDFSDNSGATDFFKILSLKTIIAGFAFFGLGGLAALTGGTSKPVSVIIAVISGSTAIYIVFYLYRSMVRLKSDGSVTEETLLGAVGNVYIRVPAAGGGVGKVLVNQQDRTMEYEAITNGDELKAGTPVTVVRVVSSTTVEVVCIV